MQIAEITGDYSAEARNQRPKDYCALADNTRDFQREEY
jgi:hypothetical protein